MINFFRKIRKQLADDNQFFKYSRYAIGEIILVVIGILIALQINNWNEERKGRQMEKQRFQNLIADLNNDQIKINQMIRELVQKQDLHYEFYEISQIGKIPKDTLSLARINSAPELFLVTGKNQLIDLPNIKNLQIRKAINDYITFEDEALDDIVRLGNLIKSRVRAYFKEIDVQQIENTFFPRRYDHKDGRPSFEYNILSQHFKDSDFKIILMDLRMLTINALETLRSLKEKNDSLQNILKSKI